MSEPGPALEAAIVALVEARDHVTFAEIECEVPGFAGGAAAFGPGRNVWFWFGMTLEGATAVRALLDAGRIAVAYASPLAYAIDGRVPNLPVAARVRRYAKPRWAPLCFRPAAVATELLPNGWLWAASQAS